MTNNEGDEMNVAVVVGGKSPEADVSRQSGAAVEAALRRRGYTTRLVEAEPNGLSSILTDAPDCVWLATHGVPGEDGSLQGFFEVAGIPYTGSGVLASALAIDKSAFRRHIHALGLQTPQTVEFNLGNVDAAQLPDGWQFPVIVKTATGGSSIGLARVEEPGDLQKACYDALANDARVLMEPFIEGRELSVGILDGDVLGDIEVIPAGALYTFEAKYVEGGTQYVTNPELPDEVRQEIHQNALMSYAAIGCEGMARVDFIYAPGQGLFLLELNTIPGMTERSLFPQIALEAGFDFDELIEEIMLGARTKC